jgi:hypothetical protein
VCMCVCVVLLNALPGQHFGHMHLRWRHAARLRLELEHRLSDEGCCRAASIIESRALFAFIFISR